MIDELNKAIVEYQAKWQALVSGRKDKAFFESLEPIAAAWKVADLADFDKRFAALRDECDQIHLGWLDERWLGMLHLKNETLPWGMSIVKLYQRRPNSTDAVGLDHVDFLAPEGSDIQAVLRAEPDLRWVEEKGDYCTWISLRFAGGPEAKLRLPGQTTLDAVIREFEELRDKIAA
jgi:hypothetical protein